ncbi:MAG: flagella basal body P-ring formation protein FlgA [Rhodospirillales bacterium CG15_BIG_FIL_POST_REV_8_21_14_020_66_15]|nr:MAG: flagella basal body P-ring formation protein FlgA [Rhodospirillales bacterium CG15_BIG_FIL_POST_REV_8_21_14_020_66_15]
MTARNLFIAAAVAAALVPLASLPAAGGARGDSPGQDWTGTPRGPGAAKKAPPADAAEQSDKVTAPLLREAVTVNDKVIYLGDLFINVGDKADAAVAYAPAPGERAIFDARWLYRVARAYRLNWRPLSGRQQVVVERVSQVIERSEIVDTIMAALFEKGADPASELELSTQLTRVHIAGSTPATVGIDDITYDARTQRFAAVVSIPKGDPAGEKLRLTGRLYPVVKIPVLSRVVSRNDVIGQRDVKWIRIRADRVMPDTVTKLEDLVGMSSKRGLRPDDVVRQSDIERPILVERGSLVTVTLTHGPMALTAQGKALERGALGDVVQIVNRRSKAVFEGEVTGPGRAKVEIASIRELAANQ